MNKATELVSDEHRQVEAVFDRFLRQPERSTAMELCALLERHAEMEEHVLYPELRAVDEQLYADATQEHAEAHELIAQIRQSHNLDQVTGLVRKLQSAVSHHVEDEEHEDLPAMERSCGTGRMDELGEEMLRWKQRRGEVPTTASTGPGDGVAHVSGDGASGSGRDDKETLLDLTKDELYEKAKEAEIPGRSSMNKDELAEELAKL